MLTAIFSVDAAYNYPRMITDQLLYYMKGLSLVQDGTLAARSAVNAESPFEYASVPALIRVPFMAAFSDFDDQLRAMQVFNIVLAILLGGMMAYIFSLALPGRAHWLAVAMSFATLILNPIWVTNILSPLADLPYAVASLGALIIITRLICGTDAERRSRGLKLAFIGLFIIAFGCRYTAPVLLLYAWLLFRQQKKSRPSQALPRSVVIAVAAILVLMVAISFRTIVFGYFWQPFTFMLKASQLGILLNTIALAVPSQIVPGFDLLFVRPPVTRSFSPQFGTNPFDVGLTALGICITAVVGYGMWASRKRLMPELAYVLAPLPILAAMIPSTPRYLLSYQPFFWVFFYAGASRLVTGLAPGFRWRRATTVAAIAFSCVAIGAVLYIRSGRLTKGTKVTLSTFSLGSTRGHSAEVSRTYRTLRRFLEALPRDRSLLLGEERSTGQWKVIAGIDYYLPDSGIAVAACARDIYVVDVCSTKALCSDFSGIIRRREVRLLRFGRFELEQVFATGNEYAAARVRRLRVPN